MPSEAVFLSGEYFLRVLGCQQRWNWRGVPLLVPLLVHFRMHQDQGALLSLNQKNVPNSNAPELYEVLGDSDESAG